MRSGPTTVALALWARLASSRRACISTRLTADSGPSFSIINVRYSTAQRASEMSMAGASGNRTDGSETIMARNLLVHGTQASIMVPQSHEIQEQFFAPRGFIGLGIRSAYDGEYFAAPRTPFMKRLFL